MKVILKMVLEKEMDYTIRIMVQDMKVSLKMVLEKEME